MTTAAISGAVDFYRQALALDKDNDNEPETNRQVAVLIEEAFAWLATEAFGTTDLLYVNSVPTDEKTTDTYDGQERTVWKTTVDREPKPSYLRAIEFRDQRIVYRGGRLTELSFEVEALSSEADDQGVREDRFGFSANVTHSDRYPVRRADRPLVEVHWPGSNTRTIADAQTKVDLYTLAITLGRAVERVLLEAAK